MTRSWNRRSGIRWSCASRPVWWARSRPGIIRCTRSWPRSRRRWQPDALSAEARRAVAWPRSAPRRSRRSRSSWAASPRLLSSTMLPSSVASRPASAMPCSDAHGSRLGPSCRTKPKTRPWRLRMTRSTAWRAACGRATPIAPCAWPGACNQAWAESQSHGEEFNGKSEVFTGILLRRK